MLSYTIVVVVVVIVIVNRQSTLLFVTAYFDTTNRTKKLGCGRTSDSYFLVLLGDGETFRNMKA